MGCHAGLAYKGWNLSLAFTLLSLACSDEADCALCYGETTWPGTEGSLQPSEGLNLAKDLERELEASPSQSSLEMTDTLTAGLGGTQNQRHLAKLCWHF